MTQMRRRSKRDREILNLVNHPNTCQKLIRQLGAKDSRAYLVTFRYRQRPRAFQMGELLVYTVIHPYHSRFFLGYQQQLLPESRLEDHDQLHQPRTAHQAA